MKQQSQLVISPMAGISDAPFRCMALQHGADYGVFEMLTAQTKLWNTPKTKHRLKVVFSEPKRILQIAGAGTDVIREAVLSCIPLGLDAIEINMGCPAKKVCNVLAGSALLRDEALVVDILRVAVKYSAVPIFLKTRLGWDHNNKNILVIGQIAQDCGVESLTIHGRTRSDLYNNAASFDLIAQVKGQLDIPVFANGDITTPEKAKFVLDYTKADGLYIGRGALGKPWLFAQIKSYLATGSYSEYTDIAQIMGLILQHLGLIYNHYGECQGVRIARKHIKWYLQSNPHLFANLLINFIEFSRLEYTTEQIQYLQKISYKEK